MKKTIALFLMCMFALHILAWKEPGTTTLYPRLGINFSKFSGDKIYTAGQNIGGSDTYIPSQFKTGFSLGAEVQHQFTNVIAGSIGLLYSKQGTAFKKTSGTDFDFKMKHNDLIVPVMLVATTKYNVDVKIGLQPEIRVSKGFNNVFNRVNLSLPVGISYEFKHVAVDLRYHLGLTHVYKDQSLYDLSYNKTIMLTLGYGFDL